MLTSAPTFPGFSLDTVFSSLGRFYEASQAAGHLVHEEPRRTLPETSMLDNLVVVASNSVHTSCAVFPLNAAARGPVSTRALTPLPRPAPNRETCGCDQDDEQHDDPPVGYPASAVNGRSHCTKKLGQDPYLLGPSFVTPSVVRYVRHVASLSLPDRWRWKCGERTGSPSPETPFPHPLKRSAMQYVTQYVTCPRESLAAANSVNGVSESLAGLQLQRNTAAGSGE